MKKGFSLIEVLLAVTIFGLVVVALGGVFFYGQEASTLAKNRDEAVRFAQEGLEITRMLRDKDGSLLVAGVYGIAETGTGWEFVSGSTSRDGFTRTIKITEEFENVWGIISEVTWQQTPVRVGSMAVESLLTNWLAEEVAEGLIFAIDNLSSTAGGRRLSGIDIINTNTDTDVEIVSITPIWSAGATYIDRLNIDGGQSEYQCTPLPLIPCIESGETIPVSGTFVPAGSSISITELRFDSSMSGQMLTLVFEVFGGETYTLVIDQL